MEATTIMDLLGRGTTQPASLGLHHGVASTSWLASAMTMGVDNVSAIHPIALLALFKRFCMKLYLLVTWWASDCSNSTALLKQCPFNDGLRAIDIIDHEYRRKSAARTSDLRNQIVNFRMDEPSADAPVPPQFEYLEVCFDRVADLNIDVQIYGVWLFLSN